MENLKNTKDTMNELANAILNRTGFGNTFILVQGFDITTPELMEIIVTEFPILKDDVFCCTDECIIVFKIKGRKSYGFSLNQFREKLKAITSIYIEEISATYTVNTDSTWYGEPKM